MQRIPLPFLLGFGLAALITAVTILAWPKNSQTPLQLNSVIVKNTNTLPANEALTSPTTNTTSSEPTNSTTNANVSLNTNAVTTPAVVEPISDFFARVTKKPFGIYITPATSPIQPEKFTGYHTGADAETTSAEADVDVPIYAMAAGTVVFAGYVNGYGGVIIIKHTIDGEKLLSLYGHVRIASFAVKVNNEVKAGERIAVLGTGYSTETDGERKHLHFGLIKGWTINYKGYVSTKSALSGWVDPVAWLKEHEAS